MIVNPTSTSSINIFSTLRSIFKSKRFILGLVGALVLLSLPVFNQGFAMTNPPTMDKSKWKLVSDLGKSGGTLFYNNNNIYMFELACRSKSEPTKYILKPPIGGNGICPNGYDFANAVVQGELVNNKIESWSISSGPSFSKYGMMGEFLTYASGTAYALTFNDSLQNVNVYANLNADGKFGDWNKTTSPFIFPYEGKVVGAYSVSAVTYENYAYVYGGGNGNSFRNNIYFAKLGKNGVIGNKWTKVANNPDVSPGSLAVVGDYLYSISADGAQYAKINPITGEPQNWQLTNGPKGLSFTDYIPQVLVNNDMLYVLGNSSSMIYYTKINSDNTLGVWSKSDMLPITGVISFTKDSSNVYIMGEKNKKSWVIEYLPLSKLPF